MLFKDNERVDLAKGESPEAKDYQEKKKWVRKNIGFPVFFKVTDGYVSPQEKKDGTIEYYMPSIALPNVSHFRTEDGVEEWRWCPIMPRKKNGEYEYPREYKRTWYDKKVLKLDEKDMDRIYYLLYKCPEFKRYYTLDDAKVKASELVADKIREAKITGVFYGENSILLKDEKKLREIARAWNISNVEKKSRDQMLSELETTVREQDIKGIRSIDDFIENTQVNHYVEVGALIQKAEDMKLIKFDDRSSCWFYMNQDLVGDKIFEVTRQRYESRYEDLREYMFVEKDHITRLKSLVNANDVPREMVLDINNLENEDWEKIMAFCNKNGIASTGRSRTKAVVFAAIRKHMRGE